MCYSTCLERYYGDNDQLICKQCPTDCYTCNSDGNCITCNDTNDYRQLSIGGKRCVAKDHYFDNNVTVCALCASVCSTCTSLTSCTACETGYFLRNDNYCYDSCLSRYYGNIAYNKCENCPYDCYTCKNNG